MLEIIKDVKVIKTAILKSRYIAARLANGEMLKLYFAIGGYVSTNSRNGHWGTGVIDEISTILQKELPGLRGGGCTEHAQYAAILRGMGSAFNLPDTV